MPRCRQPRDLNGARDSGSNRIYNRYSPKSERQRYAKAQATQRQCAWMPAKRGREGIGRSPWRKIPNDLTRACPQLAARGRLSM